MSSSDKQGKKNGLGPVGIIMLLIDVALLVVILVSVFKKDEGVKKPGSIAVVAENDAKDGSESDDIDAKTGDTDVAAYDSDAGDSDAADSSTGNKDADDSTAGNKDADDTTSGNDNADDTDETDTDDAETDVDDTGLLDTEGIEGIVDIESYSTTARPSLSDFMWYFDNVHYNGVPADATYIYDSEQLVGDWKGFIFYDPDRKMNSYGIEFLNVNLKIDGQKADVAFDLYELHFENTEVISEEGSPILNYSGNFEAGAVYATGGGNVHIDTFYTMPDKKQYAVGYIDTPDGTPAYLALVRP